MIRLLCAGLLTFSAVGCAPIDEPEQEMEQAAGEEPEGQLSPALEEALKKESGDGKSDTAQLAPGLFTSGVPAARFVISSQPDSYGKQRKNQWCWAATLQMILNFHQVNVLQEDIVLRAFGDLRNMPATVPMIAASIKGWSMVDRSGVAWVFDAQEYTQIDPVGFIEDLHFNSPLIAGLINDPSNPESGGHAYVVSAITYQVDAYGLIYPQYVELSDPWPDNPSHIRMSWQEFLSKYGGHVRVRAYLQ